MPDPREYTPETIGLQLAAQEKNSHLSPLMRARLKAGATGDKPNFCPFGCTDQHLDEHGYCNHLIGFTTDKNGYEPFILDEDPRSRTFGQRRVICELTGPKHNRVRVLKKVMPKDKFVQITNTYRVYRPGPVEDLPEPAEVEEIRDQVVIEDTETKPARGRKQKEPVTV